MAGSINSLSLDTGAKALDAVWKRSNAISDNIANYDTPGYQEKSVSFEDQLTGMLSDNNLTQTELDSVSPVVISESGSASSDGSNVDMEQQMVELMRNQLEYNYLSRSVTDGLSLLETAASEGRK